MPKHRYLHGASWRRWLAWMAVCTGLTACGGDRSQSIETTQTKMAAATVTGLPSTSVKVVSLTKVSETRVNRTMFDYVFRVTVKNTGSDALTNVVATLSGAGPGTSLIDGAVVVGDLAAGASVTANDTITLRQDRALAFNASALVWSYTGERGEGTMPGILIPGLPGVPAVTMLGDYAAPRSAADLVVVLDPQTRRKYYAKQLTAVIRKNATVAQVNMALNSVGARLVFSMLQNPSVTLQVPDPHDLAALKLIAASLKATGVFDAVTPIFMLSPAALPANVTRDEALVYEGPVFHHVASRVDSAWSAAALQTNQNVHIIVVDFFGDGPAQGLGSSINSSDFASGLPNYHGYHVLGILAASFGGPATAHGKITGALPKDMRIHVIDISRDTFSLPTGEAVDVLGFIKYGIAKAIKNNPTKKFVMNLSVGYCNGNALDCPETDAATVENDAVDWRAFVREIRNAPNAVPFDYEGNMVQVSAAGNNVGRLAMNASQFNASVLLPAGVTHRLSNGLVVENRVAVASAERPKPGTLWGDPDFGSNIGGNLGAIGTDVLSFAGPSTSGVASGTSMAAPQVAGVAAWMLGIRPMTANDVIDILKFSGIHDANSTAPALDAYAAMLALDRTVSDAPVRTALLRATMNSPLAPGGQFTFDDALTFLKAFFPKAYNPNAADIPQPDLSRHDLNGDGFTGVDGKTAPFDLKFDGAIAPFLPEAITAYPNGTPVNGLDESRVTDFEVLCYYINSDLFDQAGKTRFEQELATISRNLIPMRTISCNDRMVKLYINAIFPNWDPLPASITMTNLVPRFPATSAGNSSTCTNQGEPAGERGTPLFSSVVPSPIPLYAAIDVVGVPTQTGRSSNRRNCSSFFATTGTQVWINATARTVFGFGGSVVSDWEFQVRYSNGDPNNANAGKQCVVGTVPGIGIFLPAFSTTACSHEELVRILQ